MFVKKSKGKNNKIFLNRNDAVLVVRNVTIRSNQWRCMNTIANIFTVFFMNTSRL